MKININSIFYILLGVLLAVGSYGFFYAKGYSYMSDDPKACVNCHVMQEQMNSWTQSTHHHVAKCNDCHLPHNMVGKYLVKALNGFNHSAAFTLQNFKDPIQIKEHSRQVVQAACVTCHDPMVQGMSHKNDTKENQTDCLRCHRNVGHVR